jgi:peroxiredoxin
MVRVRSADLLRQGKLVLCFYPKDDTPGCTMEALEFTDLQPEFEACGAILVGISRDTCASHGAFRDKYGLTMRLLADTDGEVCEAYGVLKEKERNGERRVGIQRSTFIIDRNGVIDHAMYDVLPKGHAQHCLRLLSPDRQA